MKVSFFVLKNIQLLLISALIIACNRSYNTTTDVDNNWMNKSWYYYDSQYDIYYECYIKKDSITFFESYFYNYFPYSYKFKNDTIYLYSKYNESNKRILVEPTISNPQKLILLVKDKSTVYLPMDKKIDFYSIDITNEKQYDKFAYDFMLRRYEMKSKMEKEQDD